MHKTIAVAVGIHRQGCGCLYSRPDASQHLFSFLPLELYIYKTSVLYIKPLNPAFKWQNSGTCLYQNLDIYNTQNVLIYEMTNTSNIYATTPVFCKNIHKHDQYCMNAYRNHTCTHTYIQLVWPDFNTNTDMHYTDSTGTRWPHAPCTSQTRATRGPSGLLSEMALTHAHPSLYFNFPTPSFAYARTPLIHHRHRPRFPQMIINAPGRSSDYLL